MCDCLHYDDLAALIVAAGMKAENFCFWMQGFLELSGEGAALTAEQVAQVKTHLALVFKHDPTMAHPIPGQIPTPRPVSPAKSEKQADSLADRIYRAGRAQGVLYC